MTELEIKDMRSKVLQAIEKTIVFSLLFFAAPFVVMAQKSKSIIASGAKVEKLADGFGFTEGPAVDRKGNVYFTDQPNDRILVWSVDGKLSEFGSFGRANGMYFDKDGRLLSCSDMDNEIWSIGMDGTHTAPVTAFDGKKLNGPNDLWVHPGGGIYFTDPLYKRSYWTRDPEMQQEGEYVYYLEPNRKTIVKVATDLKKPNGIIGTPDGKKLYVADIGDNKTYVYDIRPNGSLANRKLFTPIGSDGMTIDNKGNVYLTGKGVTVFNSKGEKIEHIPVEANWTANICFGGKDMKTLFITASQYLYSLRMNVKGVSGFGF
jgi:gluconolactonase